jgi:hypothetical protein
MPKSDWAVVVGIVIAHGIALLNPIVGAPRHSNATA